MLDLSDCVLLGTVTKIHGIRGNIVLTLDNLNFDDIIEMETVFLEIEGLPVPFFVLEYSERSSKGLLLKFEDIESENQAREFISCKVYIPANCIEKTSSPLREINNTLGFEVIDSKHGSLGKLEEILEISSNSLMKIVSGKKEILLPLNEQFILQINHDQKLISVEIPEGLLEI